MYQVHVVREQITSLSIHLIEQIHRQVETLNDTENGPSDVTDDFSACADADQELYSELL